MKKIQGLLLAAALTVGSAQAFEGTMAFRVSTPLVVSATPGLHWGKAEDFQPTLQADLGLGGGKLLVGADSLGQGMGWGVKAGLMRTWLTPIVTEKDQTYLGAELEFGFRHLVASVGAYARIEGNQGGNTTLTAGLGWLF
jgi:hypothetical protein